MKRFNLFIFVVLCLSLIFIACSSDKKDDSINTISTTSDSDDQKESQESPQPSEPVIYHKFKVYAFGHLVDTICEESTESYINRYNENYYYQYTDEICTPRE